MFEQDYIMRLIKEMVRTILKLLFNIDTDSPSTDLLKETEDKAMPESLMNMIDDGRIDEAENKIYEITEERDKKNLEIAILFYSYLNDKSDAFLEEHNFSREEVMQGLKDVLSRYGIDSFAEMILL
ncbi:MAG: hypothetical protein HDR11_13985 [Lachnospiraceae bacterium]|nr:hypothetical protein [Lachnospiraceae bacterium]